EYAPLSRPIYIYVSDDGLAKPQVRRFVEFYLQEGADLVRDVGYVPLRPEQYEAELAKISGTAETAPQPGPGTAAETTGTE
ncbi:MAG: hypothetical protein ACREK7_03340, partial [Gemmatimonadota bacterium]